MSDNGEPDVFREEATTLTPNSDSESNTVDDDRQGCIPVNGTNHSEQADVASSPPEITVRQPSPEVCRRQKKTHDPDMTSGYGSDVLRESVASSDIPEDVLKECFTEVVEIASQSLNVRTASQSQSSSSSRKQSHDSLSLSSHDSDDLLQNDTYIASSSDSEDENSDGETSPLQSSIVSDTDKDGSVEPREVRQQSVEAEEVADRLMVWAKTELIPLCHAVLEECETDSPVVLALQSSLRQLSNAVSALCGELLRKQAGTFGRSTSPDLQKSAEIALMKPQSQLSFVVRVLSPTVNSLVPVISSLSRGFNEGVYQGIVFTLQKLAWKVEACVCYENPTWNFECHKLVFDESHKPAVARFLSATPLEPRHRLSSSNQRYSMVIDCQGSATTEPGSPVSPFHKKSAAKRVASVDPQGCKPSSPVHHRVSVDAGFLLGLNDSSGQPDGLAEAAVSSEFQQKGIQEEEEEVEEEKEEENQQEEDDDSFFRPQDLRRCQTIDLSKEELKQLGIKKTIDFRSTEESVKEFQAFRSYSLSFFRRPQHSLSRVPRFLKSIRRSRSIITRGPNSLPENHFPRRESTPGSPLSNNLDAPLLAKMPSMESLPLHSPELSYTPEGVSPHPFPSPTQPDVTEEERVSSESPKSSGNFTTLPSRFRWRSSHEKRGLSVSETVKLPRERSTPKALFGLFARRHSQHFSEINPTSPMEGQQEAGEPVTPVQNGQSPHSKESSRDEYMHLGVEVKKSKKDTGHSGEEKCVSFIITVKTNISEYPKEYSVVRCTVSEVQQLMNKLQGSLPKAVAMEKPGKKRTSRKLKRRLENFLHMIADDRALRTSPEVIEFLQPNGGGCPTPAEAGPEREWDLLATFYCPDQPLIGPAVAHGVLQYDGMQTLPVVKATTPSGSLRRQQRRSISVRIRETFIPPSDEGELQTKIIREDGKDVLIYQVDGCEHKVIAGTFDRLVKQLAGEEKPDSDYVTIFLYGQRHFAKPADVAGRLIRRFAMEVPPNASDEEKSYAAKWREIIQQRILDVLYQWMQKCWPDFVRNEEVLEMLLDFLPPLQQHENINFQIQTGTMLRMAENQSKLTASFKESEEQAPVEATDWVVIPEERSPPSPSMLPLATLPEGEPEPPSAVWRMLMEKNPQGIARQLTVIDLEYLKAIDHFELALHIWEKKSAENKPFRRNLDAYITRFNEVSFWVGTVVCSIPEARDRGAMVEKFIEVAKQCYFLKNFNTMTAILSGLSYSAVKRLKTSWEFVREKSYAYFMKLENVMDPANNSSQYRNVLARVGRKEPCIPFFGVFLKDFVFLNDGHPTRLSNGLINFTKLRTICMKIEELGRYQNSRYSCPKDDQLRRLCLDLNSLSEAELYEKSLAVEPKELPIQKSSSGGAVE